MMNRVFRIAALWLALVSPVFASQATLVTPGPPLPMATLASFLNGAFLSIGSCNSGSSAPTNGTGSAAFPGECWINTTSNPWAFSYTADGTHWTQFGVLNTSTFAWTPYSNGFSAVLGGSFSTSGNFTQAGAFGVTLTATGTTNSTLPAGTHTLAGLDVNQVFSGTNNFTGPFQINGNAMTFPGVAATLAYLAGNQTYSGNDTFSGTVNHTGPFQISGTAQSFPASGSLVGTTDAQTLTNKGFNCANNSCVVRIGSDVSGLGTGIAAALGTNVTTAGAPVLYGGVGGTPSAISLTNGTGLPIAGVTGWGTSVATALGTAVGSAGAPVLFNGAGGTPSSITLTNAIGFPVGSNSVFGIVKVDNTTITASAGVISAIGGVATSVQPGTTTVTGGTVGDLLAVGAGPTLIQFSPAPITNSLSGNVALSATASYFDGPSIAQGSTGTWWVSGTVTVQDTAGAAQIYCKLWDGTTVIASSDVTVTLASAPFPLPLSGSLAAPAANIKISCRDITSTSGQILFNTTGNSKDSTISAHRIQ